MRVLILYETRRGHTLAAARAIRDDLQARGELATISPLREVDAGSVAASDVLLVGSWVKGMVVLGVGPAREALAGIAALPPLEGRHAAVFCTCDVAPRGTLRTLASHLEAKGATIVARRSFRRTKGLRWVPAFVDSVLGALDGAGARP